MPDRVGEHQLERLHLLPAELVDPVELLLELRFGRKIPSHGTLPFALRRRTPMMHGFGRLCLTGPARAFPPGPPRPDPGPGQSTRAWYTRARSWARKGYEADGISWVMNTTSRSSTGSIQKAVLAAPPQ